MRAHIEMMAAAALTTVVSIGLGVGISVALVTTNPPTRMSQSGTIATVVKAYASLDDEDTVVSREECIACR